ncbi:tetratricopeptide repeat-containing sulfotransferase family protein [Sagittula sp. S175]|uniref:tetratricopeptide repeat-containing sulfotransferase family protein n=1 Tax=Sagittula sp. S175 TaxID=3415129 RepID=UPI003C7CA288
MTPQQIKTQFAQAQQMIRDGAPAQAVPLLKTLLLHTGGAPEIQYQLSRALDRLGDTPGAAAALTAALARRPDDAMLIQAALPILARAGDSETVLALHDRQIAASARDPKPKFAKAHYLQQVGRFAEAETLLRKLVRQNPDLVDAYRMLTVSAKLPMNDPLVTAMKRLWKHPRLNDHGRVQLGFALAKVHEDNCDTGKVFDYLNAANAAQGRLENYTPGQASDTWQAVLAAQDGADLTPLLAPRSLRQVFVCGMPRSGTTLVEQIIAAHSQVTAGGELGHTFRQAAAVLGPFDAFPRLDSLSAADLTRWVERTELLVRRDTGVTEGVVTDKAMNSQMILGLIRRAMPDASLIVVHRDPRDIALSIYKNNFAEGSRSYATSLVGIAEQIKAFRTQVAFWKTRLPGQIHEVRYEDLVSDPEPQARALIAAAGLAWEDACLSFHETVGQVKTLSLAQVRQPIHGGRREAWRKYETELAPFIAAWGDEPWE